MRKFFIPLDLVFVPVEHSEYKYDESFCKNKFISISACLKSKHETSFWNRLQLIDSKLPIIDAYDRDRLIIKNDFNLVASLKMSGKSWIYAQGEEDVIN